MKLSPYPPYDIDNIGGCPCCDGWDDKDWRSEQMYRVLDKFTRQRESESESSIEIKLDDGREFKL
jgi:hypothetical protein